MLLSMFHLHLHLCTLSVSAFTHVDMSVRVCVCLCVQETSKTTALHQANCTNTTALRLLHGTLTVVCSTHYCTVLTV